MSLKNKAAIVTGGNSGIGMAIALELDKLQRQGLEYGFLHDWSVTTFPVQLPLSHDELLRLLAEQRAPQVD
jgi:hypothetical protein